MDHSSKELLCHTGERKMNSSCWHIINLTMTMLLVSACTILLVIPMVFVTLFLLGSSFQMEATETQHQSSILLSKIHPQLQHQEDEIIQFPIAINYNEFRLDIPDDSIIKELQISTTLQKDTPQKEKPR